MSEPTIEEPAAGDDAQAGSCTPCERGLAFVGLAAAGIIGFIALDLLTGGRLTGARRRAAAEGATTDAP